MELLIFLSHEESADENVLCNLQVNTERAIRHAIQERLPIVVVINKVSLLDSF